MSLLQGNGFCLRPYREGDAEALQRAADNPRIAANLQASFPSPYTLADAESWIARCQTMPESERHLAIEIGGAVNGGIGIFQRPLWSSYTYEMGYWLAEPNWGRGIVSEAVGLVVAHAFDVMGAERVQAFVYDWNPASGRVLEKNGFVLEGKLRRAVHRQGRWGDCHVYGRLRVPN